MVESCNTLPGISDHEIVNVSSLILAPIHTPQERKIFQWDKADLNHITEIILDFSSTFLHQFNLETPINTLWNEFKSLCDTCLATVPFKFSSTKFCPPWLTRQIKRLSRQKRRRYNTARSTNLPKDWSNYHDLKRTLQRLCREAHNKHLSSLLDFHNVTKRFWSFIKHRHKDKVGINTLHSSGQTYTDDKAKANVLNNHFSSVFTRENLTEYPHINGDHIPDIPSLNIEVEGVKNLLENLDPHKSPGPDNIPSWFLRKTAPHIAPLLTLIFSLHQSRCCSL